MVNSKAMGLHDLVTLHSGKNSEICIAPKTVAIVLKQNRDSSDKRCTGERLFSLFRRANSGCSWNQQLHQAVRKVVFVGFLRPHTLLVYGTSDHIEALRSAWIKNMLNAPDGFNLLYFGELQSLYIESVSSAHFTPLPEALCSIILNMNRSNIAATVSSIKLQLEGRYKNVQPPSDQVVFETLNNLMREKKICLADSGYFITSDAHQRPLSIVFSANHGGQVYAPMLLLSPTKRGSSSDECKKIKSSPKKSGQPIRRAKTINEKRDSLPDRLDMANAILRNRNIWSEDQPRKKCKDKGAVLRKLFGMKPKKKNKPSGSIGTSSGSSSHSPVMSHDEDHVEIHQPIINQYVLDSRTSSELTSAAVPFSVSPMALNNTINESLKVHCGKTMIQPRSFSDTEFETDEENEQEDRVPEMHSRPQRNHRYRASSYVRRPIANPVPSWRNQRLSSASTTDTETGYTAIPTAQMYFERKKYKSMNHQTRNSTRISRATSGEIGTLPPNVSTICMSNTAVSMMNADSTILRNESLPLDGRQSAEGEAQSPVAHSSTPIEAQPNPTALFNATGHTVCASNGDNCCSDEQTTPKRKSRPISIRQEKRVNRLACDCENSLKCICSCRDSEASNKDPVQAM